MRRLHTHGKYASDGKERRLKVREEAGHRCIRCHHPFETGKHGKGEWTPCDSQCTHGGPIRVDGIDLESTNLTIAELLSDGLTVEAKWRILTVHHMDGNKSNDAWWNTLPLCQRCHLHFQCKVDPDIPFFFEHSDWAKPYIAGFYAWKYEGEERLDELLAHELLA